MHSFVTGFGLGFFVASQIGPMSLLLIRSTLRFGWRIGMGIAAGIALIDGLYAVCGAAGAAPLLEFGPIRLILGLAGAAVIIGLGLRTLHAAFRVRLGGEAPSEVASFGRAFRTALAGTASNPATIISWAAIFSAASVAGPASGFGGATLLVAGVALGSLTAVTALASIVVLARRRVGDRAMRAADAIAGVALTGFGGALAYATIRER